MRRSSAAAAGQRDSSSRFTMLRASNSGRSSLGGAQRGLAQGRPGVRQVGPPPRAVDDDSADLDLAEQRESVDVWEAERASDVDLLSNVQVGEGGVDVGDLLLDAGDQLGLVAAVDAEDRAALNEEPAFPVSPDLSGMSLGVDHGDTTGTDGDVVDVRLTVAGHASVVQQPDPAPAEQFSRRAATRTSPLPPCCQTRVLDGSSITLARNAPRPPSFSRARCSRASWRPWCLRNALAPALPESIRAAGPAVTSGPLQPMHVTVRAIGSQIAIVPTGSSVEQTRH
jgi:hypothetical protein